MEERVHGLIGPMWEALADLRDALPYLADRDLVDLAGDLNALLAALRFEQEALHAALHPDVAGDRWKVRIFRRLVPSDNGVANEPPPCEPPPDATDEDDASSQESWDDDPSADRDLLVSDALDDNDEDTAPENDEPYLCVCCGRETGIGLQGEEGLCEDCLLEEEHDPQDCNCDECARERADAEAELGDIMECWEYYQGDDEPLGPWD